MLRFVSGMTGAGKTKFITHQVIEYLRFDSRPILYWVALRLDPWVNPKGVSYPGLVWTCEHEFGLNPKEVRRRLVPLKESQLLRFWAWRPVIQRNPQGFVDPEAEVVLAELPVPQDGKFRYDGNLYGGAIYIIDEAHETFRKKDFGKVSDEGLSWASQNRRAGDEAWLLSQRADLVAKPFRDQSVECYWLVNHGHQVIWWWRQPDKIRWHLFLQTPPGDSSAPLRSGSIEGLGYLNGCYDTAAGASVAGGAADIGYKPKGLPFWTIPVGIAAVVVALFFGFRLFIDLMGRFGQATTRRLLPKVEARGVSVLSNSVPPFIQAGVANVRPEAKGNVNVSVASTSKALEDVVTGVIGGPGAYVVYLRSGERFPAERVVNLGSSIWANGKEWKWAR